MNDNQQTLPNCRAADAADRAAAHWQRMHSLERWFISMICFLALTVGILSTFAIVRTQEIKNSQERQECVARITAEFQGAVAGALGAPPAPNPERDAAVKRIEKASEKLARLERYC